MLGLGLGDNDDDDHDDDAADDDDDDDDNDDNVMIIPIDVTLVGIVIDVNDVQYWKAEAADDKS